MRRHLFLELIDGLVNVDVDERLWLLVRTAAVVSHILIINKFRDLVVS